MSEPDDHAPTTSAPPPDGPQRARLLAQALSSGLNLAAVLAAPRLLRKLEPMDHGHLREHLDALVAAVAAVAPDGGSSAPTPQETAVRLRAACSVWTLGPEAPTEVHEAARALLAAFGVQEPPGGWDAFEGAPDEPT